MCSLVCFHKKSKEIGTTRMAVSMALTEQTMQGRMLQGDGEGAILAASRQGEEGGGSKLWWAAKWR